MTAERSRSGGPAAAVGVMVAAAVAAVVVAVAAGPEPSIPAAAGALDAPDLAPGSALTAEWAAVVDGVGAGLRPDSPEPCTSGELSCIDAVITEMEARLDRRPCAHTAPFAFTYLEMTRGVRLRSDDPGYFEDPRSLAYLDAFFAQQYFDAFDAWRAGRSEEVPGAWQMAFEAADERRVSAAADMFLGMNAHISRDLAFAVERALRETPGFADRRDDFLVVNEVIDEVKSPMLQGAASRFDPTLAYLDVPLPGDAQIDTVELIARWRNEAFDAGRRMAAAPTRAERDAVAAEVERNAVAAAAVILNADSLVGAGLSPEERADHCRRRR